MKSRAARPLVTLIAAVSEDGFISRGTGVPWDIPADREHFRRSTAGRWLLLGRRTYEEMSGWFRGRTPLVLSRDPAFRPALGRRVASAPEAIALAAQAGQAELLVCGGTAAYAAAIAHADRLVITRVHERLGSGAAFPQIDPLTWSLAETTPLSVPAQGPRAEIEVYERAE